jgi:hypothetical protein
MKPVAGCRSGRGGQTTVINQLQRESQEGSLQRKQEHAAVLELV